MQDLNSNAPTGKKSLTYLAALVTVLLWASAFPATRYVLQYYSPEALMLLRFGMASVTLCIVGAVRKIRLPKLRDLPVLAACGMSGVFLYMYFFNTGSVTVEAGVSSFIIAASPVFTLTLSRLILKEKLKAIGWIGMAVSIIGLAAVTLTQTSDFTFNRGAVLIILASMSAGTYSFVVRIATKKYNALETTTYGMVFGTILMFFFLPDVIREVPASTMTVNLVIVFLGVFPAAIAYLAWNYALSKAVKTAHVTVFSYLIPFFSTLLAYLWLGETLGIRSLLGGVIIILGMVMTNVKKS